MELDYPIETNQSTFFHKLLKAIFKSNVVKVNEMAALVASFPNFTVILNIALKYVQLDLQLKCIMMPS